MKVFKIYFFINLSMIFGHVILFVVTIMGLGSENLNAPRSEAVDILMFMAILGASPNMILFIASVIRKKQIKGNALWASVFTIIVLLGYSIAF